MYRILLLPVLSAALLFAGCSDDDGVEKGAPVAVGTHELEARLAGETVTVAVTATSDWQIVPSDSWLTALALSGTGPAEITLRVASSAENDRREGEYVFVSGTYSDTLRVEQHGTETNLADRFDPSFADLLAWEIPGSGTEEERTLPAGKLAEIQKVQESRFSMVSSYKGIEYLTGLRELYASFSTATELDLSRTTSVETVDLNACMELSSLNLSNCTRLNELVCTGCGKLGELDLSENAALTKVHLYNVGLKKLDLSENKKLDYLELDNCPDLTQVILPPSLDTESMSMYFIQEDVEIIR